MADSDKVFPALVALHRDVSYRNDSRSQASNRMDVDMIFFSFNYRSSVSTSESRAKTRSQTPSSVLRPPAKFRQSLAYFSAIPCEGCPWKIESFLCYGEIFLPNTRGPLACLIGFWPRRGGNYLPYVNWSCKLDEYNLPSLSNLMILRLLSIKDLVYSAMVNAADGDCCSLTCDYLSLATKMDVIVNVGQCLNRSIWEIEKSKESLPRFILFSSIYVSKSAYVKKHFDVMTWDS